jgi:broad specificity phosphatase PhoE
MSTAATVVWLARHGESQANAGLPSPSHDSITLTARGHAQAVELARRIDRRPDLLVVSPFVRARQTAAPICERWPQAPVETWAIEEFSYLDPARCRDTTVEMRRPWAAAYWQRADPHHVDGPGAESFAQFLARLQAFRRKLLERGGFVVAVGHGQFFRACLWTEVHGFAATPEAMAAWRAAEIATPMANGEIIEWIPARNLH